LIHQTQNKFASVLRLAESAFVLATLLGACRVSASHCPDAIYLVGCVQVILFLLVAEPSSLYGSWRGTPLRDELVRTVGVWVLSSAILALLPLALGIGAGSAMQQPLAIAIISGKR